MGKSGVCEICNRHIHKFYVACKAQASKHAKQDNGGHIRIDQLTYESPYFLMELLRCRVREMKVLRKKLWTYQQTCDPLKKEIHELKKKRKEKKDVVKVAGTVVTRGKIFPVMLHELVTATSLLNPNVICWSPCGTGFFIREKVGCCRFSHRLVFRHWTG